MGTYKRGILGSFSGKVGTVIGSSWNGIDYMRSLPRPSSKVPTTPQLVARAKFGMAMAFVLPAKALFDIGYQSAVGKTGANAATGQVIKEGISGVYPALTMNYPGIMISKGSLTGAVNANAAASANSVLVSWEDNSLSGNALGTDKAIILVYNESQAQYIYNTAGALRSASSQTVALPLNFSGDELRVWLAFISDSGKLVANSVFVGSFTGI